MDAIFIENPGNIQIKELIRENSCPLGKVRIKIKRVSLCGSDYKLYNGTYTAPDKYPIIPGHEWSGEITECGSGVTAFKPGDKVTGDCSFYCGKCDNCKKDKNLCKKIEKAGITTDGYAVSELVTDTKYLYKAPSGISYKALALTEPFAVAYHALMRAEKYLDISEKHRILIIGCGTIGKAAWMLLKLWFDCENVTIVDKEKEQITLLEHIIGKKLKSADVAFSEGSSINGEQDKEHSVVEQENQNGERYDSLYSEGGYDLVFEMSGTNEGLSDALRLASVCGCIVCTGFYDAISENPGLITMKRLDVRGSIGGTGEFSNVLDFFAAENGKYAALAEGLVTCEYKYIEAKKAFIDGKGAARLGKAQLTF